MRNSALYAEHAMLTERMVTQREMGNDWPILKRDSGTTRTEVLQFIHAHTTGKFVMGYKFYAFEKEEDAIMVKLAFPG